MKDLYRLLGVLPYTDSDETLRGALLAMDQDAPSTTAARHILLDNHRRRVYDHSHRALTTIGQLRANLGLLECESWVSSEVADFTAEPNEAGAELDKLDEIRAAKLFRDNVRALQILGSCAVAVLCLIAVFWIAAETTPESVGANGSVTRPPQQDSFADARDRPEAVSTLAGVDSTEPEWEREDTADIEAIIAFEDFPDADPMSDVGPAAIVTATPVAPREPAVVRRILPIPRTGPLSMKVQFFLAKQTAPLKVVAPITGGHYVVKLTEVSHHEDATLFFLRAGETLETSVPLGAYNLRYANGDTWYGEKELFGPTTRCAEAEGTFVFSTNGNYAEGHEIELIKQVGGNLETDPIPLSDF